MYYPAFAAAVLGTIGSIAAIADLIIRYHDKFNPVSVSELAAAEERLLSRFRVGLFICGSLFAISMYGLVLQRIDRAPLVFAAYTISYLSILLAALLPARGVTHRLHVRAGQTMGISMLILAWLFATNIHGAYGKIEFVLAATMTALTAITYLDRKRFAYYELSYLALNHLTIVIACIALID